MNNDAKTAVSAGKTLANPYRCWRELAYVGLAGILALAVLLQPAIGLADDAHDWPMWKYDAERSAATPLEFAEDLHLQWVRQLPEPRRAWRHQWDDRGKLNFDQSYSPVVKGELIFVPSNVTDSVTAYHTENGEKQWRFYADGPVRLAPVAWEDNVYFVSDDGHLYCLDAQSGEKNWKFRGGVSDLRLLGNERIINMWPARGGPVIKDGTLYFAAGIWPMHGVFIYALDAESGRVQWLNDTSGSDYVRLPHGGAEGYGSIAPQGYIAVNEDELIVAGGRTPPVHFNRETGAAIEPDLRSRKGTGDYAVSAEGEGAQINEQLARRVESLEDELDAPVFEKLAAHGRLFVTTEKGTLYCFGPERVEPIVHQYAPQAPRPKSDAWAERAQGMLDALGEREGYALMLGVDSGDLLRELLVRSELHVVAVESDAEKVRALRDEFAAGGVYGRRVAIIEDDPAAFAVQPYLFSLIVSEDAHEAGLTPDVAVMGEILDRLRPYGGIAYLATESVDSLAAAAEEAAVDQVTLESHPDHVFASRGGPLTGAGQWTHQLHDAANTSVSADDRVRLPLGLLWYGGPNNHNILPRHSGGPRPQVVAGRQIYLGVETIGARCVYTGRQLWEQPYPGIGHPFTNLELEERWEGGGEVYMTNIPGATYIGSPLVSKPDSIYLRYEGTIFRLDPATGEPLDQFELPGESASDEFGDEINDWGHVSVWKDLLITTVEPHLFEDQVLGWTESYSGTSSRRLVVLDRYSGEVLWQRDAQIGFRHNAIISGGDKLFVIDGLSENVVEQLARRGEAPEEQSQILALEPRSGDVIWQVGSDVFGTYLMYSEPHDILIEGGSQDLRRRLDDEPREIAARQGSSGELLWVGGRFTLPGAIRGDMLIPGRAGRTRNLLTGEDWQRERPLLGESGRWTYDRQYGCNTLNANEHLLFFRSGSAAFFDLQHDSGTGNFGGFRSGCTANLIPADGVLNALDYTRTCTCSYQHQTSLALIHMPGASHIEAWTRHDSARPAPEGHGINLGAPGRRVNDTGLIWYAEDGTHHRHPSWIDDQGDGIDWVASSVKEGEGSITIDDLLAQPYTVRLHFAELQEGVEAGERVFDVLLNRETVLSNFDIVAETGGSKRVTVQQFDVQADGSIDVELRRSDGSELDPVINGVEIRLKR